MKLKTKTIDDVFVAGNVGEAIGHPVRIMTIRILRDAPNNEMKIMDLISEIKDRYDYDIPYGTYVAHIRKLEIEGICKTSRIGKFKSLKLVKDFDIVEVVHNGES